MDRLMHNLMWDRSRLKLMSSLFDDLSNAEKDCVYLDDANKTYFTQGMQEAITLPGNIDLTDLSNKIEDINFVNEILDVTSKAGHTTEKGFVLRIHTEATQHGWQLEEIMHSETMHDYGAKLNYNRITPGEFEYKYLSRFASHRSISLVFCLRELDFTSRRASNIRGYLLDTTRVTALQLVKNLNYEALYTALDESISFFLDDIEEEKKAVCRFPAPEVGDFTAPYTNHILSRLNNQQDTYRATNVFFKNEHERLFENEHFITYGCAAELCDKKIVSYSSVKEKTYGFNLPDLGRQVENYLVQRSLMQDTITYWDEQLLNTPQSLKFKSFNLLKQIIKNMDSDKVLAAQCNTDNNDFELTYSATEKHISDFIAASEILERMRLSINFDTIYHSEYPRMQRPYYFLEEHKDNLNALIETVNFIDARRDFWHKIFLGFCMFTITMIILGSLLCSPINGLALLPSLMHWALPMTSVFAKLAGIPVTSVGASAMTASILPIVTGSIGLCGYFATQEKEYLKEVRQFAIAEENGKEPLPIPV